MKLFTPSGEATNFVVHTLQDHEQLGWEVTNSIGHADVVLLPYTWEYWYANKARIEELSCFVDKAARAGKLILSITFDHGRTPLCDDAIVLRPGGYRSRALRHQYVLPRVIDDPLDTYYSGKFLPCEWSKKSVVGFCGQGFNSLIRQFAIAGLRLKQAVIHHANCRKPEPETIWPTSTRQRMKMLKAFESADCVETNFLVRKRYRAGIGGLSNEEKKKHRTTVEFFDNIKNSAYTLCIRGSENYSLRFYQTLAMGRVPLFVNTDCPLPCEDELDWKSMIPWVEYKDIKHAPDILREFHNRFSQDEFVEHQQKMRKIWEDYLRPAQFLQYLERSLRRRKII